jgi:hypothetical protein
LKKLAIIHYMPLEYYPPTTNFLEVIAKHPFCVKVWTTHNTKKRIVYNNEKLKTITRVPFPKHSDGILKRLFKYFCFNISCFIELVKYKPEAIVYYESYSVYPVFLYMKFFGKATELYIHYHEYEDQENYKNGMKLVKYYHKLEKKFLYKKATWISQTNIDRVRMFASDHPELSSNILKSMPNYPPKYWLEVSKAIQAERQSILKTVYVGSLSLKDTFIKEYCDWVLKQNGKVHFHIYAFNLHTDTKTYLEDLKSKNIVFHPEGVEYSYMPSLLSNYDIGLILYKAQTNNYKYNAPNKLFEYLACHINVLYPDVMLGIKPYESSNITPINFREIPSLETIIANVSNASLSNKQYVAEDALQEFLIELEKI